MDDDAGVPESIGRSPPHEEWCADAEGHLEKLHRRTQEAHIYRGPATILSYARKSIAAAGPDDCGGKKRRGPRHLDRIRHIRSKPEESRAESAKSQTAGRSAWPQRVRSRETDRVDQTALSLLGRPAQLRDLAWRNGDGTFVSTRRFRGTLYPGYSRQCHRLH